MSTTQDSAGLEQVLRATDATTQDDDVRREQVHEVVYAGCDRVDHAVPDPSGVPGTAPDQLEDLLPVRRQAGGGQAAQRSTGPEVPQCRRATLLPGAQVEDRVPISAVERVPAISRPPSRTPAPIPVETVR